MGFAGMGRTAIVSLNSSFLLLSIGLLVVGMLVEYNQEILDDMLGMVTDMVKGALDSLKQSAGEHLPAAFKTSISADEIKTMIKELIQNISMPLIAVSSSFIVISGSGLLGGCCKSKCFLVLYCVFLVVIILAEGVFLTLFLLPGTMIDSYIKKALRDALQFSNFKGMEDSNAISKIWTAIMDQMKCCGLEGFADFEETLWWEGRGNMSVPISCCSNITAALEEKKNTQLSPNCTVSPSSDNTNIQLGCYKAMVDKIFESQVSIGIFAGVWALIFLIEATLFFSAVAVIKEAVGRRKKVHPRSRRQRRR
ncbi:tetraspanin-1-like [Haliotis rufescens]|uniref:tetraspanin-1-like n=1 Tax=Haliotis rufescens TaxID=6454 RepID=UPI00201EECF2|nr:tetraspanin-1-like [Haliotis rufescens]